MSTRPGHPLRYVNRAPIAQYVRLLVSAVFLLIALVGAPLHNIRADQLPPGPAKITSLRPLGTSVTIPAAYGFGGNIVFQSYASAAPVHVRLATFAGRENDLAPVVRGNIIAHVIMTSDRDVTFSGYPNFALALPSVFPYEPYVLELRDGVSGISLATMDQYEISDPYYFIGDGPWLGIDRQPFHMKVGHPYIAELIGNPDTLKTVHFGLDAQQVVLSPVGGYTGVLSLPGAEAGGGELLMRSTLAVDTPIVARSAPAWYLEIINNGMMSTDSGLTLDLHLPQAVDDGKPYLLYYFNRAQWALGWQRAKANVAYAKNGLLHFSFDFQSALSAPKHATLAVIPASEFPLPNPFTKLSKPIAILGDSFPEVEILPESPHNCRLPYAPLPYCQNTWDTAVLYPHVLSALLHQDVADLSVSAQRIEPLTGSYDSALILQVPEITRDSRIVVVALGTNDIRLADNVDYRADLDAISQAILRRAHNAKIIYIGLRYDLSNGSVAKKQQAIDSWNAYEKTLGARYGAYLDISRLLRPGASTDSPDGEHGTYVIHEKLARMLARVIAALESRHT